MVEMFHTAEGWNTW